MIKLKYLMLMLCVSVSPMLAMQPKKEVTVYKKNWLQRHPVLAVAGAAILALNCTLPSREVADMASNPLACHSAPVVVGGGSTIMNDLPCYNYEKKEYKLGFNEDMYERF